MLFLKNKVSFKKNKRKAHILLGYLCFENIDKVIDIIKSSNDTNDAKEN